MTEETHADGPFPDPHSLGLEELKLLLEQLISREQGVSNTRNVLHAQIDALRREFVDRLREEGAPSSSGPTGSAPVGRSGAAYSSSAARL
jgi:hypothetical protein